MGKPWARYEVGFIGHDKFRAIPGNAICLWLEGKNYADAHSTDGLLPAYEVKHWRFYSKKNVDILMRSCGHKPGADHPYAPLWVAHPVGFQMHDYLDHNDCRDAVLARKAQADAEKQKDRNRKAAARAARWSGGSPAGSPADNRPIPADTGAESDSIQNTEVKETKTQERGRVERNGHDAGPRNWPDGWLADLESLWKRVYAEAKHGAVFNFNWRRDEDPMIAVYQNYGHNLPRLEKMLGVFFRMHPREVKNIPGTPAQFNAYASEIDARMRQDGQ